MEAIIIILIVLLAASGWIAYGITLRLVNERDTEKERYKKALELAYARTTEEIENIKQSATEMIEAANARIEEAQAIGKQEGKRVTLEWIQQQVKDGTLEIRVIGEPVKPQAQ
jgi:hypothetical protein